MMFNPNLHQIAKLPTAAAVAVGDSIPYFSISDRRRTLKIALSDRANYFSLAAMVSAVGTVQAASTTTPRNRWRNPIPLVYISGQAACERAQNGGIALPYADSFDATPDSLFDSARTAPTSNAGVGLTSNNHADSTDTLGSLNTFANGTVAQGSLFNLYHVSSVNNATTGARGIMILIHFGAVGS